MIEVGSGAGYLPILFPEFINHKDMGHMAIRGLFNKFDVLKVRSAGFWSKNVAYGESETLKLKSHTDDTDIIRKFLS